jgi:hypothetical protein
MFVAYAVVTVLAAVANIYAATNDFVQPKWMLANMNSLKIPLSWLPGLGALKAAGALGLFAGFALPALGMAAAIGLVVFFVGAIVFTLRAKWYAHLPFPIAWLSLVVAALALHVAAV